jgi:predicted RNA-binding protein YlxR (DUF448 family)/ribosomal protein L30E
MQTMTTNDESAKGARRGNPGRPERTCAGCGKHAEADVLVRVVLDPGSGEVAVDLARSGFGRGAHVHGSTACLAKALRGGFARVFKAQVKVDAAALAEEIVNAADRRIDGLLGGARRAGQLAIGADAVVEALRAERAHLVVVARDAAAAARLPEIERAIASGKAVALGDKDRLGRLFARDQVAVLALLHEGVAAAVASTFGLSAPFRPRAEGVASADLKGEAAAWSSSEVR